MGCNISLFIQFLELLKTAPLGKVTAMEWFLLLSSLTAGANENWIELKSGWFFSFLIFPQVSDAVIIEYFCNNIDITCWTTR